MKAYKEIKSIWFLAYPMILSSLIGLLFGIGDQAIIGRVNVEGYAAVSVVANCMYVLTGSLGIFGVVFNILGSKALGEKNNTAFKDYFNISMTISIIIGVIFFILAIFFGEYFLSHFFALKGKVLKYGMEYLYITGVSLGLNSIIFVFCSYLKNIRRTQMIFWASLIPGLINLAIDYVLVFGKFGMPRLEVSGAAIGSVIGLLLTIFMFVYEFNKTKTFNFEFKLNKKILKEFAKVYFPMAGQDFLEYSVFAFVLTAIVARLGTYHLATYNLLSALINILILPVYAFAGASLTIVAKSIGENDNERRKNTPFYSALMAYLIFAVLCGVILIFPKFSASIITDDKKIIMMAVSFILIALVSQVFNVSNQVIKNSLFAIGEEKWAFNYSLFCSIIGLIAAYIFSILMKLSLNGIYMALSVYYLVLTAGQIVKYYKGYLIPKVFMNDIVELSTKSA